MNIRHTKCLIAVLMGVAQHGSARANDFFNPTGDFYFPVGVGISSGHFDVFDKLEDLYRAAGFQL